MTSATAIVVWKEFREIRRDPVTLWIAAVLPLILLYLFASALSLDVKDAPFAVYDQDRSAASRALADHFVHSGYFRRIRTLQSAGEIEGILDQGRARMVLVIPPEFSRRLATGEPAQVQALIDGSYSATAMVVADYTEAIIESYAFAQAARFNGAPRMSIEVVNRVWFNASLESVNSIVPGLFAVILMAFPPLLTALAVVREKESGSVQQIYVSPIKPYQFIAGKAIPYAIIAFVQMLMILAAGVAWFRVPFVGSVPLFLAATALYVLCTVGLGLLISSLTRSQLVALLLAFVVTVMPSFLFSGFLFPIFTMPEMMQMYTYLFPARHFVEISRGIAMKGQVFDDLWPLIAALAAYTVVVFMVTVWLFRKKVAR